MPNKVWYKWDNEITYPIPKLQQLYYWNLGMAK